MACRRRAWPSRAGLHVVDARELLLRHHETYPTFWRWAEQNINAALLGAPLFTRFGWPIRLGFGAEANPRSLLNWPMQANGAEMMRLACCMATEAGLMICAPIHDALLLEAPADELDEHVAQLTAIMQEASTLGPWRGARLRRRRRDGDLSRSLFRQARASHVGSGDALWIERDGRVCEKLIAAVYGSDPGGFRPGTRAEFAHPYLSYLF